MTDVFDALSKDSRRKLRKQQHPEWLSPMLAKLTHNSFSDPDWIYERKLDGERCLVFRKGNKVRLLSRNKKELNNTYPELVEVIRAQPADDFVVDGEIVAFDGDVTSFSRLQQRIGITDPEAARKSKVAVYLYLFDAPHLAGHDTTQLSLRDRKSLLKRLLSFDNRIRYTAHRNEVGEQFLAEACERGWEGLIAKKADSPYTHSRSSDWLKFKCVNRQEFVIAGFTDPHGSRIGFGALLIGYYDGDDLQYAGKVGTGFNHEMLRELGGRLLDMERKSSPYANDIQDINKREVHWVSPQLVGEVAFTEWTRDGRLRHPRFVGLRRDKKPKQVIRERPE